MDEKIMDLLIDVVKYVFTAALIYPLLASMDKDWKYYSVVLAGLAAGAVAIAILHHFIRKKKNNNNDKKTDTQCKYKYKYKYKSITKN
jgi:ABC-type enterobactin transport system permease subunit